MIRPTAHELLTGVADELHESVLPELAPGAARAQLVAAIAIIRRLANSYDALGPYLDAENRDMAEALRMLLPRIEDAALHARTAAMLSLVPTDQEPYPSIDELTASNDALQALVAEVHRGAGPSADEILVPLYGRMLARESELLIAPRSR